MLILAVLLIPAAFERYFPLDSLIPGFEPEHQYRWLKLLLAAALFWPLLRSGAIVWRPTLAKLRDIRLGAIAGAMVYLNNIWYYLFVAAIAATSPLHDGMGRFGLNVIVPFENGEIGGYLAGAFSLIIFAPLIEEFLFPGSFTDPLAAKPRAGHCCVCFIGRIRASPP